MSTKPHEEKIKKGAGPLDRVIFVLTLALVAWAVVPYGSVDPWWEGVFECAAFALGALWVIESLASRRAPFVREHRLLAPVAALVLYAFVQTLAFGREEVAGLPAVPRALSFDPEETWRFAVKTAALASVAALLLRYTTGRRRLRALVWTVTGACAASALFGLVRQASAPESLRWLSPRLAANIGGYAQFINRNHFALLAEMGLGLALGAALASALRRRWGALVVSLAAALVVWAALVASGSRGGLLGMFALLSALVLLYFTSVRRAGEDGRARRAGRRAWLARAAAVACLFALVGVGAVWVGGERLAERLEAVPGDVSLAESKVRWGDRRNEIWGATARVVREHPLAGVGFGAYRAAVTRHHDASGEMSLEQAHNDYLELLASGGLVALALAAWLAYLFARRARAVLASHDTERRALAAGALAGLAAVAVHSLFDFGLHVTANAAVFVALAVVAVVSGEQSAVSSRDARLNWRRPLPLLTAHCLLLTAFCLFAWYAARAGTARLFAETVPRVPAGSYEAEAQELAARALRMRPGDPEVRYAAAVAAARRGDYARALAELEESARLRPRYYVSWLRLGRGRERTGDEAGALAAYAEAARLAPAYAEPRWQLGNALLRAGHADEAFAELRLASASRPSLFAYTVELAWRAYGGDAGGAVAALAPRTASERAALARFLVRRGAVDAALAQYREVAPELGREERRALVAEMLKAGRYAAAREVWAGGTDAPASASAVTDGGFEQRPGGREPGFGWQFVQDAPGVRLSLDQSNPRAGSYSLRLDFNGEPPAGYASQLLSTEPGARYRLRFAARTEELASAALPLVALDTPGVTPGGERLLAESAPLARGTSEWAAYAVEFQSPAEAVLLTLRRQPCAPPCPIHGRAWLDEFSLEKLEPR